MRLTRRLLPLLAGLCLASCLSPTLPLPPPDRPDMSAPDENGLVRIQGIAAPKAEVNDFIELWYMQGSDESQTIRLTVPEK